MPTHRQTGIQFVVVPLLKMTQRASDIYEDEGQGLMVMQPPPARITTGGYELVAYIGLDACRADCRQYY